jgi:hypothetical protein
MAGVGSGGWPQLGGRTAGHVEAEPLRVPVREAVATLLSRHVPTAVVQTSLETSGAGPAAAKRIAIVPIGNAEPAGGEAVGPRLGGIIQQRIDESTAFEALPPRTVVAGLEAARLKPADLLTPDQRRSFVACLEQQGTAIDSILLATIEPADAKGARRRDRVLTLMLVDAVSGATDECRKPLPAATAGGLLRLPMSRPTPAD